MTSPLLDPHPALVVVDLQRATTAMPVAGDMTSVVANAARLARAFRERDLTVVLALNDLNHPPAGRTTYDVARPAVPPAALEPVEEVAPSPDDVVVTRGAWSAFAGTDLDTRLRERDVTQLVVVGLAASFGIESTARAGYDLGYSVLVVEDAVTGPLADANAVTLTRTVPALGRVVTAEQVLSGLSGLG